MKAVKLMRTGMSDKLVDFTNDLDTEPREKIIDVIANYLGVKATEKMFRVKFLNRKEEIELDEGKMKKVVMDIDNVAKGMMKNKMMKPFADKFKKDAMKSMNIRKSLEKILPDYVAGKDIQKLMASHCMAEEIDEASKEGTIRIIDLGTSRPDKIRKELGVDGLPNKGFQVQRMTKGKFVNQGKPYKSQKDAEKVRKDGQYSMQFEAKMSPKQISQLKKGYESLRGKKISAEMGMKLSRELEKLDKDAAIQLSLIHI